MPSIRKDYLSGVILEINRCRLKYLASCGNMVEKLMFGIETLDKLLHDAIYPDSLIVVAGHPGSGKTTLASTMCYSNALNGFKCLYISFQESRDKLFRTMKSLGMDFSDLENRSLYHYLRIPILNDIEDIIETINKAVSGWGPRIIVIDSINALLQAVEDSPEKRAWLQNYFYSLPEIVNGVAILVTEIPFEEKRVDLGAIEFVADAVIVLKHRIERGLLTRCMEIRKARGAPITLAEVSFTIVPGKGIEVFVPPLLTEIGRSGPELKTPCTLLDNVLSHIHKGHSIYIEYPPDSKALEAIPIVLGTAFRENLLVAVISYLYSPETMIDLFTRAYLGYCNNINKILKTIEKYVKLYSLNPFRYSLAELIAEETRIIRESKADIIIFHGIDIIGIVGKNTPEYIPSLYNQINMLKQEHKVIVRVGSKINDELSNLYSNLADIIIKFIPLNNYRDYNIYIWRRGIRPMTMSSSDISKCLEEIAQSICRDII